MLILLIVLLFFEICSDNLVGLGWYSKSSLSFLVVFLFDCLIKIKKLQYVFLWLSSPDHVRVTDATWVAQTYKYGPGFPLILYVFFALKEHSLGFIAIETGSTIMVLFLYWLSSTVLHLCERPWRNLKRFKR